MPTIDELRQYLAGLGLEVPDFILEGWLEVISAMGACLTANYPPATAKLIALYTLSLYAVAAGDRYVSSQSAPSGASRSFRFLSTADRWNGQWALLQQIDKHGCSANFVPPNPTGGNLAAYVGLGFR